MSKTSTASKKKTAPKFKNLNSMTKAEMRAEITDLRAKTLRANSSNSSTPPSKDITHASCTIHRTIRKKSMRKPGAQLNHKGHGIKVDKTNTVEKNCLPEECSNCPNNKTCRFTAKTYNVIDVRIVPETRVYHKMSCNCRLKGYQKVEGKVPEKVTGTNQYGENLVLIIMLLVIIGMVSNDRIVQIVQCLTGFSISVGTVGNIKKRFASMTWSAYTEIGKYIKTQARLYADETGCRVNGVMHWIHVACNEKWTYLSLQAKRGMAGIQGCGILTALGKGTIVMSDFWGPYLKLVNIKHCFCLQHLQREAQANYELTGQEWAKGIKDLFSEMIGLRNSLYAEGKFCFDPNVMADYKKKLEKLLKNGFELNPEPVPAEKGRVKRGKALNYLNRINKNIEAILTPFMDFSICPTNNLAEQAVRFAGRMDRIVGGFRTYEGGQNHMAIMSYVATAKKHNVSASSAIMAVLHGEALDLVKQFEVADIVPVSKAA